MIIAGLYGGLLADTFDRRKVALIAETVAWISVIGLAILAWQPGRDALDVLRAHDRQRRRRHDRRRRAQRDRPAPHREGDSCPRPALSTASASASAGHVGPAIAGVLVATVGVQWTYTVDAVLFLAAFTGVLTLPPILPEGRSGRAGSRR